MPLVRSCSLDALRANIAELLDAGHDRDQAVAIAHATLREACSEEGKPVPSGKDAAPVVREFKRKKGERGRDYLEEALNEARKRLTHFEFSMIHQAARSRAGARASARTRATPVEKSLLLGPASLRIDELDEAMKRADELAAADMRRGIDMGGANLARLLWAEKSRRAMVAKGDPGPSDVHVNAAMGLPSKRDIDRAWSQKGDVPGHEFRGNQYADGAGGGSSYTWEKTDTGYRASDGRATITRETTRTGRTKGFTITHRDGRTASLGRRASFDHAEGQLANWGAKSVTAKADPEPPNDPDVGVLLRLPKHTAEAIAFPGGETVEELHITLAHLGHMSKVGPDGLSAAVDALQLYVTEKPLKGVITGIGRFAATEYSGGKDVIVALVDILGLASLRSRIVDSLKARGLSVNELHDFVPHITLAYVHPNKVTPDVGPLRDLYFDSIALTVGNADTTFALGQQDPMIAARLAAIENEEIEDGLSAPVVVEDVLEDGMIEVIARSGSSIADNTMATAVAMSAIDVEPGDMVELTADAWGRPKVERFSTSTVPASIDHVTKAIDTAIDHQQHNDPLPFVGSSSAKLVFVTGAPSALELARAEPLVGPDGVAFADKYLAPLGVTKADVALGFACPVLPRVAPHEIGEEQTAPWREYVAEQLKRWPGATVVAVGKAAATALGDRALLWLPHPFAARSNEQRYEEQIERKIRRVRKALDDGFVFADDSSPGEAPDGPTLQLLPGRMGALPDGMTRIAKASREKQIVYGVVLDPYMIDTQQEWVPPAVVEASAHGYLKKSRVVGREHTRQAKAEVVESWVVHYPSRDDYQKAMALQPHRAYEMPFGDDKVHSGTWVAGVQLSDDEWAAYERGEITGFSVGGFSYKTSMTSEAMPKVEFVPLVPAGR